MYSCYFMCVSLYQVYIRLFHTENSLRYFSLEIVVCPKKDTVLRFEEGADLLGLLRLLGQEHSLDVGEDTTLGNGDSGQKLVQLLVITDGELKMTGDDPGLLVVTGSVSCQLENLSSEVFHDGSKVHGSSGTDALAIVALAQKTVDTSYGELQTSTAATGLCLALGFASFTTSRHFDKVCVI